jgi:DMSO/TMAO reductase YedYZ molybdopterin-dependent catalytic subunit
MENQRVPVSIWRGAALGASVSAALAALFYIGHVLLTLPQPFFELFDRIARLLPGALITAAIDSMVMLFSRLPGVATDAASKAAEQTIAVVIFLLLGAVFGALTGFLMNRARRIPGAYAGALVALIPAILTLVLLENFNTGAPQGPLVTSSWVLVAYLIAGIGLGSILETKPVLPTQGAAQPGAASAASQPSSPRNVTVVGASRRTFIMQLGGTTALAVLGWGVGRFLGTQPGATDSGAAAGNGLMPTATPMPTGAPTGTFVAVPGTRLEVTPNDQFYRVDINTVPPRIDPAQWTLTVGGQVDNMYILNYAELVKLPAVEQYATLECISNPVGGGLISTTRWKGVTLKSILERAKVRGGVVEIMFTSADGYTESLPLESAMDERTLLAYQTNDEPLAPEHGYPLRLYVPNRYGMKNPKWITKIEAITEPFEGYWKVRGWDKQAFVKSTSIIDVIAVDLAQGGVVPVGGIAFAGDRGIKLVEVSVDDGPWQAATLKEPLSPLNWVLWRLDWNATKGYHTLTVRCTDSKGALQIQESAPLHPTGASGYVSKSQSV